MDEQHAHGQPQTQHEAAGHDEHDTLTLRALLDEPPMRDSAVLTGDTGLGREVQWCLPLAEVTGTGERLDGMVVFVRASELEPLEPADRRCALRGLAERGAVALLAAGQLELAAGTEGGVEGLALVRLPETTTYRTVSRLVAEKTLARATHVLQYGVTVHRVLGELLYEGAGLPALGRQIAKLSRRPAFILDAQAEVLVYEFLGTGAVPDPSEVVRLLRNRIEDGRLTVNTTSSTVGAEIVRLQLEDGPVTCVVAPIVLGRAAYGWLAIVELVEPPARHDLSQHRVIAEQGATIVGSEMLRRHSVEEAEERARGDFVHALLYGRFANSHDLIARAAHHDFDVEARYAVVVAHGLDAGGSPESLTKLAGLSRVAERLLPRRGIRTLSTVVGDVLVVVRKVGATGPHPDAREESEQVAAYARELTQDLQSRLGHRVAVTYGRPNGGARAVAVSYREARIALGVCERLGIEEVSGYGELRVFAALADIASSPQGRTFAREVLHPLRRGEGAGGAMETAVMAYVESGGNLNAAARALSLHRNTMLYKLDRASRLLGMDLRLPENRFTVWLASRIDALGEVEGAVDQEFKPAG